MVTTAEGYPIEVSLTPGSYSDTKHLRSFELDFPEGSVLNGDKAYNEYFTEDLLAEASGIELLPHRKKNSTRAVPAYIEYIQQVYRKKISGGIQPAEAPPSRFDSRGYGTWLRTEGLPVRARMQHRCTPIGRNLGYLLESGPGMMECRASRHFLENLFLGLPMG